MRLTLNTFYGLKTVTLVAVTALGFSVMSPNIALTETRALPFDAWKAPTINENISLKDAIELVEERVKPQDKWYGPSEGPLALTDNISVIYVSADQSYVSFVNWGRGVEEASQALGWNYTALNGKGTVTGTLQAMQQAIASKPDAIITSADASALQEPIAQAIKAGIPVIGIHASAFPGPDPKLNLYTNITSSPAEIGETQAAYVIAESKGKARVYHFLDNSFAIARFKGEAATKPVINLEGCQFIEMINIPIADQTRRIPTVISGIVANESGEWWGTTCCDNFYPYAASSLRASGIAPDKVHLVGSDGPPSAYDLIRNGEYEVATVPEPSTLFGYQAIDAVVRAMAGVEPSTFIQPTYLVTAENVDAEGGDTNEFIPSNDFACHYKNLWLGEKKKCGTN